VRFFSDILAGVGVFGSVLAVTLICTVGRTAVALAQFPAGPECIIGTPAACWTHDPGECPCPICPDAPCRCLARMVGQELRCMCVGTL